ncbi:MAG: hypothetical protein HYV16_08135 [Gammaproteobacteria bacterium]|nr:hypothetical protein [Gammaproteobacteria bacterium]
MHALLLSPEAPPWPWRRIAVFAALSLAVHGLLLSRLPAPGQAVMPFAPERPLRIRLAPQPSPPESTPAREVAPKPPKTDAASRPAPARPRDAQARPKPSPPEAQPIAAPSTRGAGARPGLLITSLEAATTAGERLELQAQARADYAPCKAGSEMTARCAQARTFAQAAKHELEYQGEMPNLVAAADAAEAGRVAACSSSKGGGLLSLGCLVNMPHLLNKAANKLIRKSRRR